jgi:hypothetical protein
MTIDLKTRAAAYIDPQPPGIQLKTYRVLYVVNKAEWHTVEAVDESDAEDRALHEGVFHSEMNVEFTPVKTIEVHS